GRVRPPTPPRPGCPCRWSRGGHSSGSSPAAPSGRLVTRWSATRAPPPPACGPPSGSRTPHDQRVKGDAEVSEPKGRGVAWTEEREARNERRSDEGRRRSEGGMGRR